MLDFAFKSVKFSNRNFEKVIISMKIARFWHQLGVGLLAGGFLLNFASAILQISFDHHADLIKSVSNIGHNRNLSWEMQAAKWMKPWIKAYRSSVSPCPNWPLPPLPQLYTFPSLVRAKLWRQPQERKLTLEPCSSPVIVTGRFLSSLLPVPNCPNCIKGKGTLSETPFHRVESVVAHCAICCMRYLRGSIPQEHRQCKLWTRNFIWVGHLVW